MHDIDRTQLESDFEGESYESEQPGWTGEGEVFGEAEEMELASELMAVRDEQELDQFLSALIRNAGRALGRLVGSPDGQAIGSILKGAAKQLLPHAAGAVGAAFGGPLGARISSGIASLVDGEMGQEAEAWTGEGWNQENWNQEAWNQENWNQENWNQEDSELEGARQFVRVAADTVRDAMAASGMTRSDVGRASRDRAGGRTPGAGAAAAGPLPDGTVLRTVPGCVFRRRERPLDAARQPHRPVRRVAAWPSAPSHESMLAHEARALLARLALVKPFALQEPMLPAAALLPAAQVAIDRFLVAGRRELRRLIRGYLRLAAGGRTSERATAEEAQRRFAILRLKFNIVLIQFDIFADVITQRSENETGRVAVRPRRGRGRRAGAARLLRRAAGHLLPRPRHRRRDPAGAHAHAGRRREPGRHHPRAARAHGRHRHRVVAGARGRAPGGGAARSGRLAAAGVARPAARRQRRHGSPGSCGSAGSPRSSPTSGRWRGSASPRRSG